MFNMVARAQCNAAAEQQPEGWRIVDPPPCLGGSTHRWVPDDTHSTPVPERGGCGWLITTTQSTTYSAETGKHTEIVFELIYIYNCNHFGPDGEDASAQSTNVTDQFRVSVNNFNICFQRAGQVTKRDWSEVTPRTRSTARTARFSHQGCGPPKEAQRNGVAEPRSPVQGRRGAKEPCSRGDKEPRSPVPGDDEVPRSPVPAQPVSELICACCEKSVQ